MESAVAVEQLAEGEVVALIGERPVRIGQLVDFADAVPAALIEQTVSNLCTTLYQLRQGGSKGRLRLRYYVILGALISRLLFELEGVPGIRDGWL